MAPNTLVTEFLRHLESTAHRSERTVEHYHFYLKRFLSWSKIVSASEISTDLIKRYRLWLSQAVDAEHRPLKASTQNYHLIALRSWLAWLKTKGHTVLSPNAVILGRLNQSAVTVLSSADSDALLAAPMKTQEAPVIQLRDKALLELLVSSGLKVAEVAGLKRNNINQGILTITTKKHQRSITLNNQARYWLEKYLQTRTDSSPAVFIRLDRAAKQNSGLTSRSIQRLLHRYGRIANLGRHVTPQLLRSTVAHRLLAKGANMPSVTKKLGHASTITTKRYALAQELQH